jgi:ABC-2 type transport system ATP-binding protein
LRDELAEVDRRLEELRRQLDDAEQWEGHLLGAIHAARVERKRLEKAIGGGGVWAEGGAEVRRADPSGEIAIDVRNLSKAFRLPINRPDTLKGRVLDPLRGGYELLQALEDITFQVRTGEFLGVAGPNGSGKSTLLKVIAGIYAADSGEVRAAGRIAPFIELGVGMNNEMAAYDNVVMSGVLMGLEPDEARARFDDVIAFAGLREFTEMKLKNYSSGMRVRLGFSVMAQVDADILLVDEVLAVGDADFRKRCLRRLQELRANGTTVVFVTHAMEPMVEHCDRAILLEHGRIALEGDPGEVADRVTHTVPEGL